jgi:ATP-dependent DNA helicase RecG
MSTALAESALNGSVEELAPRLLDLDEDQWFERKSNRIAPRDLANALIGFANADGGIVVVGLSEGRVEGVGDDVKKLNALLQANVDFCVPPVRTHGRLVSCLDDEGGARRLLVFDVDSSESVHANQRDDVFLRVGDENRRLTFAQRQELLYDKGQAHFEARPSGLGFEALDRQQIGYYAEALGATDSTALMHARGLANDRELTIAGVLLFGAAPQSSFPEAFIRVLRYRGRERGSGSRQQLIDDVKIEGPIPLQLLEAKEQVEQLQPMRTALGASGRFGDVPLVPVDAWLEGIVNAAVHRSYSAAGDHIRVEIFDDRIEISSPGRFPGLVDLSDPLKTVRFARNPRIARVCADLNFGQELGEGIRRMFEEMRHAGLTDPVYRQTAGSVELQLLAEPVDRRLDERLSQNARAITRALRTGGRLSTGEVTEALGVSRPVAQRELGILRDAGIVEWVGKSPRDPRAYWQLRTG